MPVGPGRYRVTRKGKKKIRLHFTPSGKVNEAKNLESGETHTPAEFAADRKQAATSKPAKKAAMPRRRSMRQIFGK